ncbi:MAG: hypothetical protein ABF723_11545 [Lentilactobacillus hilgardii]|jgi:hypothetical protein|nr:hypothetical protein [Lentilactobacillus hilgardii]EEI21148.1 hypothetical protein HMPREF0497_0046 [Lentilactobacillus buchneri ATCC 11577]MCI2020332.1 hypothetical protein [Lentilactobacillus buchneri]EEI72716.1 hypothetical protein HMPREF0496_0029 [Lentilactobacillus hilgardii ATCC 27305]MCP9333406.1 hypothetical protein [Lentilactobacillus hilgardii]MCP9349318.1 hypothetical protein [Lentilactobacillus hilgardii]
MNIFNFFPAALHGFHSVRFIHFIFNEQPMIGIALIVALVLYMIYKIMNR